MPQSAPSDLKLKVSVSPADVVSDGKSEVAVQVRVNDASGKPVKDQLPVRLTSKAARVDEEKPLHKGAATFKYIPKRPTGKTRFDITVAGASERAFLIVRPTFAQYWLDIAKSLVFAFLLVMLIIRPFITQVFYIPSSSMEPTLYQGDRLLAGMFVYRFTDPKRGDVIIFKAPTTKRENKLTVGKHSFQYATYKDFIKRIVAVGGDTVEVKDGKLFVNGKSHDELYIKEMPLYTMESRKVPRGKYFVMGDNRNNSYDSRYWGPLDKDKIVAKAWFVFWPFDRMKFL